MAGLSLFYDKLQGPKAEYNGTYIKCTGQIQKTIGQVECRLCTVARQQLSSYIYSTGNDKPYSIRAGLGKWVGYIEN